MDDYYPFGLSFNSYQRPSAKKNDFLYNGKEEQECISPIIPWTDFLKQFGRNKVGNHPVKGVFLKKSVPKLWLRISGNLNNCWYIITAGAVIMVL
jgi:hypothetical protein